MMKTSIIFDLDGTLLDTSPGIWESIEYATKELGYPRLTQEQLRSFIGPRLQDSFVRCCGCTEAQAEELTKVYRRRYSGGALLNAVPYEGIFAVCEALRQRGVKLYVATSKPEPFARQILEHFGFAPYFAAIHGADMAGKVTKTDVIRLCVGDTDPGACVMVGDTAHDARGAQAAEVPFLAALYGFGDRAETLQYPHIGAVEAASEIVPIILGEREVR